MALNFFAQEGSVGMELARDHRLGARAHGSFGAFNLGVESIAAYGVSGDPLQTPIMASSWISWESDNPFLGHLRWDGSLWDAGLAQQIHLGLGWRTNDTLTLWLGSRSQLTEEAVSDFPGADAFNQTHTLFFQLTSRWMNTTSTNNNMNLKMKTSSLLTLALFAAACSGAADVKEDTAEDTHEETQTDSGSTEEPIETANVNAVDNGDVVINEVLAKSDNTDDWIELYNKGASLVDLSGWSITDDAGSEEVPWPFQLVQPLKLADLYSSGQMMATVVISVLTLN